MEDCELNGKKIEIYIICAGSTLSKIICILKKWTIWSSKSLARLRIKILLVLEFLQSYWTVYRISNIWICTWHAFCWYATCWQRYQYL